MSVLLNSELEDRIQAKFESGLFESPSDVVKQGLDLLDSSQVAPGHAATFEAKPCIPVWEEIVQIGDAVPSEHWLPVPSDLSKNLDHYLYGSPKTS